MIKRIIISIFCLFYTTLYSMHYNCPGLLKKGEIDLGISMFVSANESIGGLLLSDFGIHRNLNSVFKAGYMSETTGRPYFGLELKMLLFKRFGGTDNFTINFGGHYKKDPGVDFAITIGNVVNAFNSYVGLDFDFDFVDKEVEYPASFILGVKLQPFSRNNHLVVEAGIPITSYSSYKLGLAMRFNL